MLERSVEEMEDKDSSQGESEAPPHAEMTIKKQKKTRRGKKKKSWDPMTDLPGSEVLDECESKSKSEEELCELEEGTTSQVNELGESFENLQTSHSKLKQSTPRKRHISPQKETAVRLRPTNVPQAPKNSTQFIIDDHEDCNLYLSFEQSAAFENRPHLDLPLATDSPQLYSLENETSRGEFDRNAFFTRDFEATYRTAWENNLAELRKEELLERVVELEQKVMDLESKLSVRTASALLARLQRQLLSLQEQNKHLCAERARLRKLHQTGTAESDYHSQSASSSDDEGTSDEEKNLVEDQECSSNSSDSNSSTAMSDCGSSCSECMKSQSEEEIMSNNVDHGENLADELPLPSNINRTNHPVVEGIIPQREQIMVDEISSSEVLD